MASAVDIILRSKADFSDKYLDIIRRMFTGIPMLQDEISVAIESGETEFSETAVHQIKAHSAILGAMKLSGLA